ncbi:ATPase, T2SS/T4P/T4SS family [Bythopirellula polymerisocia]|uniref:Type II secretion system protein E n=1 Tax=Bythopirellula polymerisocia TaxID=2528003 RepID=A0A5C6CWX1_9BACT|nr:ATPase, T2SS/T4P/T4SS family [Bythopirellula polymerisocia]TWU29473.1 Type II secretion system protein E [Bythopirellula polymerisocia]
MNDQWFFEIGDGNTYGPYPLEKLQKWAEAGNLMPTHRVRNVDSSEWVIAAYVPGLELTTVIPDSVEQGEKTEQAPSNSLGTLVRGLGRKHKEGNGKKSVPTDPPDIVAMCNEMLKIAFLRGASDLHIDPERNVTLVQIRVDGELETIRKLPKNLHNPVVSRCKVLSNMDIAERRLPQDGRFVHSFDEEKRKVSIRAACLPTTHGERMTLRLLALETEELTLNRLGMSRRTYDTFVKYASQQQGMILMTGPTGSGKSTTLYAALRHRLANYPGRIITVEDPVEFDIVGVAQAEVDTADKVQFTTVLRNILRSDPDVIMIGEIRDFESVDIAIKAALTGHLVFSSLHTNSAAGVVTRLIDMGVKSYQVAATLRLCVAQRLVKRLCSQCRKPRNLTAVEAANLGNPTLEGSIIYEPGRCERCNERGFHGRVGIFEMLPVDDELIRRIVANCDESQIVDYMRECKMPRLRDDAVDKLLAGATSLDEILGILIW